MNIAAFTLDGTNARLADLIDRRVGAEPEVARLRAPQAPQARGPRQATRDPGSGAIRRAQTRWNGLAVPARGVDPIAARRGPPGDAADIHSRSGTNDVRAALAAGWQPTSCGERTVCIADVNGC